MSAVGGIGGGAGAPNMPPPSAGWGGDDPFEGEEMESVGGSEFGGEAGGGGADTVDLSAAVGGDEAGTSTESFADDGGAASYDADGGVDDMDAGGEIDAMV